MFSSIKMEEYMESELSGIFRVKLVTKNIVRRSPGTQFMHMRVNGKINNGYSKAYDCSQSQYKWFNTLQAGEFSSN